MLNLSWSQIWAVFDRGVCSDLETDEKALSTVLHNESKKPINSSVKLTEGYNHLVKLVWDWYLYTDGLLSILWHWVQSLVTVFCSLAPPAGWDAALHPEWWTDLQKQTTQKLNSNKLIIAWDQTWSQMNFLIKWAPIRIKKKLVLLQRIEI